MMSVSILGGSIAAARAQSAPMQLSSRMLASKWSAAI
jgi:hypothetical protein